MTNNTPIYSVQRDIGEFYTGVFIMIFMILIVPLSGCVNFLLLFSFFNPTNYDMTENIVIFSIGAIVSKFRADNPKFI